MTEFALKEIQGVKYVRLGSDGKSFEPACMEDVPGSLPERNSC